MRIHTHWSNKVRPRLHNEYLSIPSPTKWDHFSLSFLSSVRFFVTRARRDPSTSSRPPRSDARVVSEIRGQIFVFLLFPSFSFCQSPSNISTVELADSNKLDRKTPGSEQKNHSLDEDGYDENEEKLCARAKLVAVSHVQLLSSSAALQGETHNTQASVKKSW